MTSRAVNSLSEEAELFYRRLMSVVDDYGRMECDVELIRAKCFPRRYQDWPESRINDCLMSVNCAQMTDRCPLVSIYEVDGRKYLQINKFGQRVRVNGSRFPSPDGHMTDICPPKALGDSRKALGVRRQSDARADEQQPPGGAQDAPPQPPPNPIREISDALEEAVGRPVDAETPSRLCRETSAEGIHPHLTARWVREKGAERRKTNPIRTPGIFLDDWPAELRAWLSANLGALAGGRYALLESPGCGRCGSQMFRFEDGCIVPCACKPRESKLRRLL